MKLTEAQKARRIKAKLSYQKHHKHLNLEQGKDGIWRCVGCNKEVVDKRTSPELLDKEIKDDLIRDEVDDTREDRKIEKDSK